MRWAKSHKNFRLVEIPLARFSNSKIQKQKFEDTKKKKEKFERHEKNGDNGDINGKCHLHDEISIYPQNFTSSQIYPRIYHRVESSLPFGFPFFTPMQRDYREPRNTIPRRARTRERSKYSIRSRISFPLKALLAVYGVY